MLKQFKCMSVTHPCLSAIRIFMGCRLGCFGEYAPFWARCVFSLLKDCADALNVSCDDCHRDVALETDDAVIGASIKAIRF